jgi:hypothetical protein
MDSDTTTIINPQFMETKSENGPKTVYKLSDKQPFVNSSGYSTNNYSEFFISCATRGNIPIGDVKILTNIYNEIKKLLNDKSPQLFNKNLYKSTSDSSYRQDILKQIKLISDLDSKEVIMFLDNVSTIRDDITRTGIPFDRAGLDDSSKINWDVDWRYLSSTKLGEFYQLSIISEWIGLISDKNYETSGYLQGLLLHTYPLYKFCDTIEEAFVLIIWFRYKNPDSIYTTIFTSITKNKWWHSWIPVQMLINKHPNLFNSYAKIGDDDKEMINHVFLLQPFFNTIYKLQSDKGVSFTDSLIKMYYYTIFANGSIGMLIYSLALFDKILKNTGFTFHYVDGDNNLRSLEDIPRISDFITSDTITVVLEDIDIFKAKEYFNKNKKQIGKHYRKGIKSSPRPDFKIPKGPSFLRSKFSGGKRKKIKFTKKEWIKITKKKTLKKY